MSLLMLRSRKKIMPLDIYKNNIVAGWSFYRLLSSYRSYCVRVRRSSDNAEQDFGFINGYIDFTSILTFVGAGNNGYVSIWYNNFIGGSNATQITNARQPRIVNAGVFENDGIRFIAANTMYMKVIKYTAINIVSPTLAIYCNTKSNSTFGYILCCNYNTSSTTQYAIYTDGSQIFCEIGNGTDESGFNYSTSKFLAKWISTASNGVIVNNNGSELTFTRNATITERANVHIGCRSFSVDGSTVTGHSNSNIKTIVISNSAMDYSVVSKV